ncbi:MAG TPA: hypothetical protein VGD07_04465 [Methylomirabilota bacterium]
MAREEEQIGLVHAAEPVVEDDGVEARAIQDLDHVVGGSGHDDVEALGVEPCLKSRAHLRLAIDDQDARRGRAVRTVGGMVERIGRRSKRQQHGGSAAQGECQTPGVTAPPGNGRCSGDLRRARRLAAPARNRRRPATSCRRADT